MPPLDQIFRHRRILLTGGTGFLGKVFLLLMLRHHPEVERIYLLIRGDKRSSLNRFRREILDSPVMTPLREHLGSHKHQAGSGNDESAFGPDQVSEGAT